MYKRDYSTELCKKAEEEKFHNHNLRFHIQLFSMPHRRLHSLQWPFLLPRCPLDRTSFIYLDDYEISPFFSRVNRNVHRHDAERWLGNVTKLIDSSWKTNNFPTKTNKKMIAGPREYFSFSSRENHCRCVRCTAVAAAAAPARKSSKIEEIVLKHDGKRWSEGVGMCGWPAKKGSVAKDTSSSA